jgi:hypothetical protein
MTTTTKTQKKKAKNNTQEYHYVYFYVNENQQIWGCYDYEDINECFRDEPITPKTLEGVKITDIEITENGTIIFYGIIED